MMNQLNAYALKIKDETARVSSRSGGAFTALSDYVLENDGVVYGCAITEQFEAAHQRAVTKAERNAFRGSKYIQSFNGTTYCDVKKDLTEGKTVLYSGTPCQVDGLLRYLQAACVDSSRLITVDILCHGVASPKVWIDYIHRLASGQTIVGVDFRNSKFGWNSHVETIVTEGESINSDKFKKAYLSHYILRPSCFHCYYRNFSRVSDITIGDAWGIEYIDHDFADNDGVSLVLTNTEKGKQLFSSVKNKCDVIVFPLAYAKQTAFNGFYPELHDRDRFWDNYSADTVIQKMDSVNAVSFKTKLRNKLGHLVKQIVGGMKR